MHTYHKWAHLPAFVVLALALSTACGGWHHRHHHKHHHKHHYGQAAPENLWKQDAHLVLQAGDAAAEVQLPCRAGEEFFAAAEAKAVGMTQGCARVTFRFCSKDGVEIAQGETLPDETPASTTMDSKTLIGGMGIAPEGAASVTCTWELYQCNAGASAVFDAILLKKWSEKP